MATVSVKDFPHIAAFRYFDEWQKWVDEDFTLTQLSAMNHACERYLTFSRLRTAAEANGDKKKAKALGKAAKQWFITASVLGKVLGASFDEDGEPNELSDLISSLDALNDGAYRYKKV